MEFLPKLSQNLLEILDDEEYYDITIEVGDDPNVILRYIYGGKLSVEEYDTSDLLKILVTANELNLQELSNYLQSFLVKNNASWIEQNFNLVYQTTFENNSFLELQKYCNNIISKKPDKLFKSLNFSSIPEKVLIQIIQNDDLQMREIQEFSDNVLPYKKILPKELYTDLLKTFLNLHPYSRPSGKSKPRNYIVDPEIIIDSKIITNQQAVLISKWIDKLDITNELTSYYEFKLIFRGSLNEFSIREFHEMCDHKPHTVIIAKVENSNEILGGYNPVEWKSAKSYGSTKDSFIFSFENSSTEDYILSRVKSEISATWNDCNCGPYFGGGDFVLYNFYDNYNSYCRKKHYEKPIRKSRDIFTVKEYEVFQITKVKV
ncbi:carbohydrate-binding module family 13 protein [Rhizophagus clarus]|uniref:Carbohydrate-binding module family 13 protein n=1 Tax=Rhizophagus clarus TaxID=94130 RepID=A0A8H3QYN9_9GLOM|nr:carbohydrate-binding module family 13 protein [Rhizophagus clarus]